MIGVIILQPAVMTFTTLKKLLLAELRCRILVFFFVNKIYCADVQTEIFDDLNLLRILLKGPVLHYSSGVF